MRERTTTKRTIVGKQAERQDMSRKHITGRPDRVNMHKKDRLRGRESSLSRIKRGCLELLDGVAE